MSNFWQLGLRLSALLIGITYSVLAGITATAASLSPDISTRLAQVVKGSSIKTEELSLLASLNESGQAEEVISINPEKGFIPASLTKILTAGMSLEKYPVGHRFVTQLSSVANIEDGTLKGNLFLKGGGDPSFVSESMWLIVNEFARTGIKVIEGDLVVDESRFDDQRFDSGRDPSRVDRAYDAPIGAMSFNWNSVNIFIRPGKKAGDKAIVFVDPENSYIHLVNQATTGKMGSKSKVVASRKANGSSSDTIIVSGSIPLANQEVVIYKGILHPDIWSAYNLKSFLENRRIQVKGEVKRGITPQGARILAQLESKSIGSILADMMKFSNNFVAEMLTKNLAAELSGPPGSMEKGLNLLSNYLVEKGFKMDNFSLTSPSGLSRRNRLSARQFFRILEDLRTNFTVFPEFVSALPILGVDGTLKSRLVSSTAKGWVRAKTGMLSGVAGLAGYAGRADGGIVTFVFLFNGSSQKTNSAKQLFDSLAKELVR